MSGLIDEEMLRGCYALRKAGWAVAMEPGGHEYHAMLCKMALELLEKSMDSTLCFDINSMLTLAVWNNADADNVVAAARLIGVLEVPGEEEPDEREEDQPLHA